MSKEPKGTWYRTRLAALSGMGGYKKPDRSGADEDGISLRLDSNENFVLGKKFQQDIISQARLSCDVREYPLGGAERLARRLARHLRVSEEMIGVGNGSDQILDLFLANMASKKTRILTSDPTFGFFEERCRLYSIPMTRIPFSAEMKLDVGQFAAQLKKCQILYLDSPNNPTGFQFPRSRLESLIADFGNGLVIIDEAYGEFGGLSTIPLTKKYDNLIVVKTFSKAFGLAGLRLGYFAASPGITGIFNRVIQHPYPVSSLAVEAGILALDRSDQMREAAKAVRAERGRIAEGLRRYGAFTVFDSEANFVLFDAGGAAKRISAALAEQGISIRRLGRIGNHRGCLRVTVGTREMNSRFLLAMRDLLG